MTTNIEQNEEVEPSSLLVGLHIGAAALEVSEENFRNTRSRSVIGPSYSVPLCVSKDLTSSPLTLPSHSHCCSIHSSQKMGTA